MIQSTAAHRLLLACTFAVGLAGATHADSEGHADSEASVLKISSAKEREFEVSETPHGTADMSFVVLPGWHAGINRFEEGKSSIHDWTYWYDEVLYVIRGRGRVTASAPPYAKSEIHDIGPGDMFSVAPSTRISVEALGDDVLEIFFAVPE